MSLAKRLVALFITISGLAASPTLADGNPQHVPAVLIPLTETELLDALREGHLKTFGTYPSKNRLAMGWGQVAFENAAGRVTFNHNLGNIGASAPDQPTYFNRGDKHWYRSFASFEDGAAAYWATVKHCQPALAAFEWGNPREAAIRLKRCSYFEASLDDYTPGFSRCFYYAAYKLIPKEEREQAQRDQELLDALKQSVGDAGPAATTATDPPADINDVIGDAEAIGDSD